MHLPAWAVELFRRRGPALAQSQEEPRTVRRGCADGLLHGLGDRRDKPAERSPRRCRTPSPRGTFEEIARQVGYSNGGAAYKAVHRALDQVDYEAAVELRQVQLLRLDEMLEHAWRVATDDTHVHQVRAVGQVLDIIDRINALTGLSRR
ncbi:MAG: hypothetical protein H0V23_05155 [Nocardioidaceae bacterium]|nr:hypothetical protein [Nocardioidaceae bacterium]